MNTPDPNCPECHGTGIVNTHNPTIYGDPENWPGPCPVCNPEGEPLADE
jgi:DnaJ-class molecular chaperone